MHVYYNCSSKRKEDSCEEKPTSKRLTTNKNKLNASTR